MNISIASPNIISPLLLGPQALEPLEEATGKTLGWFAVVVLIALIAAVNDDAA